MNVYSPSYSPSTPNLKVSSSMFVSNGNQVTLIPRSSRVMIAFVTFLLLFATHSLVLQENIHPSNGLSVLEFTTLAVALISVHWLSIATKSTTVTTGTPTSSTITAIASGGVLMKSFSRDKPEVALGLAVFAGMLNGCGVEAGSSFRVNEVTNSIEFVKISSSSDPQSKKESRNLHAPKFKNTWYRNRPKGPPPVSVDTPLHSKPPLPFHALTPHDAGATSSSTADSAEGGSSCGRGRSPPCNVDEMLVEIKKVALTEVLATETLKKDDFTSEMLVLAEQPPGYPKPNTMLQRTRATGDLSVILHSYTMYASSKGGDPNQEKDPYDFLREYDEVVHSTKGGYEFVKESDEVVYSIKTQVPRSKAAGMYVLHHFGGEDAALKQLSQELVDKPWDPVAWTSLGNIHRLQGSMEWAVTCYEKALEIEDHPDFYLSLGTVTFQMQDYNEAQSIFLEGLKMNSSHVLLRYSLGHTLLRLGKKDDALQAFESTLVLDPEFTMAELHVFELLGRNEDAHLRILQLLDEANYQYDSDDPTPNSHWWFAWSDLPEVGVMFGGIVFATVLTFAPFVVQHFTMMQEGNDREPTRFEQARNRRLEAQARKQRLRKSSSR